MLKCSRLCFVSFIILFSILSGCASGHFDRNPATALPTDLLRENLQVQMTECPKDQSINYVSNNNRYINFNSSDLKKFLHDVPPQKALSNEGVSPIFFSGTPELLDESKKIGNDLMHGISSSCETEQSLRFAYCNKFSENVQPDKSVNFVSCQILAQVEIIPFFRENRACDVVLRALITEYMETSPEKKKCLNLMEFPGH